ncbi:hypothetical protein BVY02_01045 [bacterium J17]|nr:hypothetical protein BVY02_01045 [bacterium J17]
MSVPELAAKVEINGRAGSAALDQSSAERARLKMSTARHKPEGTLSEGKIWLADGVVESLPAADRIRMVRAKIDRHNLADDRYHVITVTSAVPKEGKSVMAANLARAFGADPVNKTLLIDGDLRRPAVHKFFGLRRQNGLGDVLSGRKNINSVIHPVAAGLDVVTAGSPVEDPTRAIENPIFAQSIDELRKTYRYIIIDCPPVFLCPEPITMSSIADGTVVVARAWRTEKRLVQEAVDAVGKSRIIGVVLNDGIDPSRQYDYYGYHSYGTEPTQKLINFGLLLEKTRCYFSRLFSRNASEEDSSPETR